MRVCMFIALFSVTACSKQTFEEKSQDAISKISPLSLSAQGQPTSEEKSQNDISKVSLLGLLAQRQREAPPFLQKARAAQFAYFASNGVFCGHARPAKWPSELPAANQSVPWASNQNVLPKDNAWLHLGIAPSEEVHFQYEMAAGKSGESGGLPGQNASRPWFWLRAVSALDDSGTQYIVEVTSDGASPSEQVRIPIGKSRRLNEILK